jgi:hypothetical protein
MLCCRREGRARAECQCRRKEASETEGQSPEEWEDALEVREQPEQRWACKSAGGKGRSQRRREREGHHQLGDSEVDE